MSLQEHHWALKKGDVTVSAVAEHVFEAGHQVDFSHICCLLESWHIQQKEEPLARTLCNSVGLTSALSTCFFSLFSVCGVNLMCCVIFHIFTSV